MTEEELNESIIKDKIQGICQDCIYLDKIVPIINQMLKEKYIKGLEQGKLDKEMEKKQLITFLKDKIKECKEDYGNYIYDEYSLEKATYDTYQEVLNFVRGDKE